MTFKVNPESKNAMQDSFNDFKENMPVSSDKNMDTVDSTTNTTPVSIREARDRLRNNTVNSNMSPTSSFVGNPALMPSARISALNIVGDLLRKVGVSVIVIFVTLSRIKFLKIN